MKDLGQIGLQIRRQAEGLEPVTKLVIQSWMRWREGKGSDLEIDLFYMQHALNTSILVRISIFLEMSQHLIHYQTTPSCFDHHCDIRFTHPYLSPEPPHQIRSTLSGLWEADGFSLGKSLQVVFCVGPTQLAYSGSWFHRCTAVI